jgi:hypothetical protein
MEETNSKPAREGEMKTRRILAILVATLIISSALYAAPKQAPANSPNPTVTTDGAVWGGHGDGAVWGGSSAVSANPHGSQQNNASDQGSYHQGLIEYLKSLMKGVGVVIDGAVWG